MKNTKTLFKAKKATSMLVLMVTLLTMTLSSCSNKEDGPSRDGTKDLVVAVQDAVGKKILGVTVTLKQAGQNDKSGITGDSGRFTFTNLAKTKVNIVCTYPQYIEQNITIDLINKDVLNITMQPDVTVKTLIPDPKFEEVLISKGYDTAPIDGSVPTYKINRIIELQVDNSYISDLKGIQDFIALQEISCDNNSITTLDVSKNLALTDLRCQNNKLTALDVSKNGNLKLLSCGNNPYLSSDAPKNTLTTLDVSKNVALEELYCGGNQILNLDVSKNVALKRLGCDTNKLTILDLINNIALTTIACDSNMLTTLDVSKNTALTYLNCSFNKLTTLDVHNNTALNYINCSFNKLTSLDVSKNTALGGTSDGFTGGLYCSNNLLTTLNFKNGNNANLVNGNANFKNNASGLVIAVDDVMYSKNNWDFYKDAGAIYVSSF
jgi:hypothetical protein